MLSFGENNGDRLLCVATNEDSANTYKILLIYVTNAGTPNYPSYDTNFYRYWLGDPGKYLLKSVDSDP